MDRVQALRPVNQAMGNLRGFVVSELNVNRSRILIHFKSVSGENDDFDLRLDGVLDFIDRGLMLRPLTAGIVWQPVGVYGRKAALRLGVLADILIELRIDYEDAEESRCLFQAVARSVAVDWQRKNVQES